MLDIKFIRENKESVMDGLRKKKCQIDIGKLIDLDEKRRELIQRSEYLKAEQNEASKKIAKLSGAEKKDEIEKMSALKEKIQGKEKVFAPHPKKKTRGPPPPPQFSRKIFFLLRFFFFQGPTFFQSHL